MNNDEAVKAGFSNTLDRQKAKEQGITDPKQWAEAKAKDAAEDEKARQEADAKAAEEKRIADEKEATCLSDLKCAGEKFSIEVASACRPLVERLAKFDFEWTTSWGEPKFSHFRWKDQKNHVISYIGDKIKLQNGFGAWQPYTYVCDYNFDLKEAVDINGAPGRLPN